MSIESILKSIANNHGNYSDIDSCIDPDNLIGIDITLHDYLKNSEFTHQWELDITKVNPLCRKKAFQLMKSGVIHPKNIPKKVKQLLELRGRLAGVKGKYSSEIINHVLKHIGFIFHPDLVDKETLASILEGYGYVDCKTAEKQGIEAPKIYREECVKKDPVLYRGINSFGKKFEGTVNFSAGIRELGFRPSLEWHSERSILETLKKVWPYEDVKKSYALNDPSILLTTKQFADEYPKIYHAMKGALSVKSRRKWWQGKTGKITRRGHKKMHVKSISIRERINNLYPEFNNLFTHISNKTREVNIQEVYNDIISAQQLGKNIYSRNLKDTADPGLRKIRNQLRRICIDRKITTREAIKYIIKKGRKDTLPSRNQCTALGEVSELAMRIVLLSAQLIDNSGQFYQNGFSSYFPPVHSVFPVLGKRVKLIEENSEKYIYPDFFVANLKKYCIVEVRTGTSVQQALDPLEKYRGKKFRELGNSDYKIIFNLQMPADIVNQVEPILAKDGILVIGGKKFSSYFFKALDRLYNSHHHKIIAEVCPNKRHSLSNIVEFHKKIIEESHIVTKASNSKLFYHHRDVLHDIASSLEKAVRSDAPQSASEQNSSPRYKSIHSSLKKNCENGAVCVHNNKRYFKASHKFSGMKIPTSLYVGEHLKDWQNQNLKNKENEKYFIPLEEILFVDIENTGLHNNAPIFLNGIGGYNTKKEDLVFEGLFARDPYEEEIIMEALKNKYVFGKESCSNKSFRKYMVTFNGSSFDWTRLKKRFESYAVPFVWKQKNHLDIRTASFPLVKKSGLPDGKLTTIEKNIFRFSRPQDDVHGRDIPYAYWNYGRGGDPEPLGRILRHNAWDIAATAATYVFLLNNPKFFNKNCLDSFHKD